MIEGLIAGRIVGQPLERTGKTDKPYALAKVKAATGEGEMLIVNVISR